MDNSLNNFQEMFQVLQTQFNGHTPNTEEFKSLAKQVRLLIEQHFNADARQCAAAFGSYGSFQLPFRKFGEHIDSLNLLDLHECILLAYYGVNRRRYKRVADIGANVGVHSIIQARCGFEVRAYEPDPLHVDLLHHNLCLNQVDSMVKVVQAAVSAQSGQMEFIRVLGNTTSSHLAGSKANPYGQLERLTVKKVAAGEIFDWADLVKIDAEGHEPEILLSITEEQWLTTDAFVEIESERNAEKIFSAYQTMDVNLFAQKIGWQVVRSVQDMPFSYKDGSLFISCKSTMNWSNDDE